MSAPVAVGGMTVLVVLVIAVAVAFMFWVAWRTELGRRRAAGVDPEEPLPEPRPDRREQPGD